MSILPLGADLPTPPNPSTEGLPAAPRLDVPLQTAATNSRRRRWRWIVLASIVVGLVCAGAWLWHANRVRHEWRQAEAALDRLDFAKAAAHLDRYLKFQPDDAAAWFLAARTARRSGRVADAERCLERCQQLGGITDATRLEWNLLSVQQGDLSDVHMRLRMTIGPDHPDAPLVLEALARGYQQRDRFNDVLEACHLWIAIQPDHPWPRLWRGAVYELMNNYHKALADYERAFASAPDNHEVRHALGALFVRARRPDSAAEHFEYLLERSGEDEEALVGLAACRFEQGRPADATLMLERALARNPAQARALFLRGKIALQEEGAAGAERWLVQAVRQAPDDPEALHLLILALRAQTKQSEADRLAPRLESLRQDIARRNDLLLLVARNPEDSRPRHEAGVLALRIGRTEEGVRWLQGALRAKGDHRPTHAALAEHFRRQNDPRAEVHDRLAQTP